MYGTEPSGTWKMTFRYINPALAKAHAVTGSLFQWMLKTTTSRGSCESDIFIGQGEGGERGN